MFALREPTTTIWLNRMLLISTTSDGY